MSFETVSPGSDSGRYSFLGIHPFLTLKYKEGNTELRFGNHNLVSQKDPFDLLDSIINTYKNRQPHPASFYRGRYRLLFHTISKIYSKKLPKKASDDIMLPDMYFFIFIKFCSFTTK